MYHSSLCVPLCILGSRLRFDSSQNIFHSFLDFLSSVTLINARKSFDVITFSFLLNIYLFFDISFICLFIILSFDFFLCWFRPPCNCSLPESSNRDSYSSISLSYLYTTIMAYFTVVVFKYNKIKVKFETFSQSNVKDLKSVCQT